MVIQFWPPWTVFPKKRNDQNLGPKETYLQNVPKEVLNQIIDKTSRKTMINTSGGTKISPLFLLILYP